jgi:hypothetical protein
MKTIKSICIVVLFLSINYVVHSQVTWTAATVPSNVMTSSTNPTTCGGNNGTATAPDAGIGGSYLWSDAQTTRTAINLVAGTYTVTVTNSSGCSAIASVTLNDPGAPVVTMSITAGNDTICAGTSVTFTAAGGATTYDFTVNGTTVQSSASPIYTTTTLVDGDIIGVTGTTGGCSGSATAITMVVYAVPSNVMTSSTNPTSCGTATGTATAPDAGVGGSYLWSDAQTTRTAINLVAGTYTVTVTNSSGCSAIASTTLSDPGAPVVTMSITSGSNPACAGTTVTFTAAGGAANYDFTVNGTSVQSSALPTYTTTTLVDGDIIGVTGTTGGCSGSATAITMVVRANPTATFNAGGPVCPGSPVTNIVTPVGVSPLQVFMMSGTADLVPPSNTNPVVGVTSGTSVNFTCIPATLPVTYTFTIIDGNGCVTNY